MIRTVEEKGTQVVGRISYMTNLHTGFMWDDTYASHCLDCLAQVTTELSDTKYWLPHPPVCSLVIAYVTKSLWSFEQAPS